MVILRSVRFSDWMTKYQQRFDVAQDDNADNGHVPPDGRTRLVVRVMEMPNTGSDISLIPVVTEA